MTRSLFPQSVSVMALVLPTVRAVQVATVFAFPTTRGRSVTNVHPATMDTQTVLVSGPEPCMSSSVNTVDKPVGFHVI